MSLPAAIALLDVEVAKLQGRRPSPGDTNWYLLQGKSLGLSLLKTLLQKDISDPLAVDQFRRDIRVDLLGPPPEDTSAG